MSHLALHDHGLIGIEGANTVISNILSLSPPVSELSLGHNSLQSSGTNHLFTRLLSLRETFRAYPNKTNRRWRLEKITLSSNGIDGDGLKALGQFLDGDAQLKEVYLPHNSLNGPVQLHRYAQSILRSRLSVLSFNTNPISVDSFDAFVAGLSGLPLPGSSTTVSSKEAFPTAGVPGNDGIRHMGDLSLSTGSLPSPPSTSPTWTPSPLTTLHLSMVPLTLPGLFPLLPFLSSPSLSYNLSFLYLNACSLSWKGLYILSMVLERDNFDLEQVEVSSNFVTSAEWLSSVPAADRPNPGPTAEGTSARDIVVPTDEMPLTPAQEEKFQDRLVDILDQTIQLGECVSEQDWDGMRQVAFRPFPVDGSSSRYSMAPIEIHQAVSASQSGSRNGMNAGRRRRRPPEDVWADENNTPTYRLRAWYAGLRSMLRPAELAGTVGSAITNQISDIPSPINVHFLNTLAQSLQEACIDRIKSSTRRNREVKLKVQTCALSCLPIARVVLLGRKKTKQEDERDMAKALIRTVEGVSANGGSRSAQAGWMIPPIVAGSPGAQPSTPDPGPFRLLDLPPDVILTILRYSATTRDETGPLQEDWLSDEQWHRLFGYAGDRQSLARERRSCVRLTEVAKERISNDSGRKAFVFQDGLSTSYPLPRTSISSSNSGSTTPFHPGPGHFGRSEWLHIVGVAGRAGSWAGTKTGGTFPGYMPVGAEERAFVDETLQRLGLMRWDSG